MSTAALKQRVVAKLCGIVKKTEDAPDIPILQRMVYAVCREGVSREEADRAYAKLLESFFDLNEVRVSAAREVARAIQDLPESMARAERIIAILQEVFETTYAFDLETLQKKGVKQVQKQLERYRGASPFMVAYVVRHSLDGHAVPVDADMLRCLKRLELVSDPATEESAQEMLEQMIPKVKSAHFAEAVSRITREYCFAIHPKCPACPVHDHCPSAVLKKSAANGKLVAVKSKK